MENDFKALYSGMIINALLAERRRFLGMTLQRVARMSDKLGGGSLTLIGVMYHTKVGTIEY
jgi:hypothetical protein